MTDHGRDRPTLHAEDHFDKHEAPIGTSTYFGPVEVIDHGARGFYVTGHTPDFGCPWGHYSTREQAHAAARVLHRLITEYERLGDTTWHESQARLYRWYEAQAYAESGHSVPVTMHVLQWTRRAERHEREAGIVAERGAA